MQNINEMLKQKGINASVTNNQLYYDGLYIQSVNEDMTVSEIISIIKKVQTSNDKMRLNG